MTFTPLQLPTLHRLTALSRPFSLRFTLAAALLTSCVASIQAAPPAPKPTASETLSKQALEAAAAGRFRAASIYYAKIAQLESGSARLKALLAQADVTWKDKRVKEAISLAEQVERLAPTGDSLSLQALLRQARWTRDCNAANRPAILVKLESFTGNRHMLDFIISEIEWHAQAGRTAQAVALAVNISSQVTDSRHRSVLRKLHNQHLNEQADELLRAANLDEERLFAIGSGLEKADARDDALALYAQAAKRLPPNSASEALRRRAVLLSDQGDDDSAAQSFRQALQSGAGQTLSWRAEVGLELAHTLWRNRRRSEALALYRALANQKDQSEVSLHAQLALARAAFDQGKLDEAAALITPALRQDSHFATEARALLTAIEKKRTPAPAMQASNDIATAEKLLATARRQLAKDDANAAKVTLDSILTKGKVHPRFTAASILTASCERALGRPREAQRVLKALDSISIQVSEQIEAALVHAEIHLLDFNQPARALEVIQRLLESAPAAIDSTEVRLRYASILFVLGRGDEARATLALLATHPKTPPSSADRLIAAAEQGASAQVPDLRVPLLMAADKHREALRILAKQGPARSGDEASAWRQLQIARCHSAIGEHKKALENYAPFIRELSGSRWADDALLRMAVVQIGPLNDARSGRFTLEALLNKYPQGDFAPRALLSLALLDKWAGRKSTARGLCEKLLQTYPGTQEAVYIETQLLPQLSARL